MAVYNTKQCNVTSRIPVVDYTALMDNDSNNKISKPIIKLIFEWLLIGTVAALLYFTGMHTEVLGTIQRAVLWTGLFDAQGKKTEAIDGSYLTRAEFGFIFDNQDGKRVALQDFRGKVLFVNVWASWCPPCVAEMPTIESLYTEVSGESDIQFIMLSMDENRERAVEFMEGKGYKLPYHFPVSPLPGVFRSSYIPSTFVVSKEGQLVYEHEGLADYSSREFRDWLVELSRSEPFQHQP